MALLLNSSVSDDGTFIFLDFIFSPTFEYDSYQDLNIYNELSVYLTDVDQGWIQIISTINTAVSVMLFDSNTVPDNIFESTNFIGSHVFKNFVRISEGVYHRDEDILFFYETGINLRTLRVRRIGKVGEASCKLRGRMIWRRKQV